MFIIKWVTIICGLIWGAIMLYPKIDAFIDVKKTTANIVKSVHDGIRTNENNNEKEKN